jgi:hypothetical protein
VYDSPKSKEVYSRFIAESAVNPIPAPPPSATEKITVVELCAAFIDHAKNYYPKNGIPTRRIEIIGRIVGIVSDLYGLTPANEFDPLNLRAIQNYLIGKSGYSVDSSDHYPLCSGPVFTCLIRSLYGVGAISTAC